MHVIQHRASQHAPASEHPCQACRDNISNLCGSTIQLKLQVPCGTGDESDAKDEAMCPTDMNCITDDDLRNILMNLPDGVKFTMVAGEKVVVNF